jgi:hypothetical protein
MRVKTVNNPAGGWEGIISPIGRDGLGGYQLYEDITINFAFFRMSSFRVINFFRRKK